MRATYAAAVWAFAFAAASAYWAAGGTVGLGTLSPEITERVGDPEFVAVVWVTGALKALAGMLAFALAGLWPRLPRWPVLFGGWGTGVLLTLYGAAGLTQAVLTLAGVLDAREPDHTTLLWYALLWEPFWLLGGILFLLAAWRYGRSAHRTVGSQP